MSRHPNRTTVCLSAASAVVAAAAATALGQPSGMPSDYRIVQAASSNIASVAVGDFNGDGKSDLAWTEVGTTQISVALATGGGAFGSPIPTEIGERGAKLLAANFVRESSGAPRFELAAVRPGNGDVLMFASRGDGRFDLTGVTSTGGFYKDACLGDLNGDGIPEIVLSRFNYPNPANPVNNIDAGAWNNGGRGIKTILVRADGTLTGVDQLPGLATAQGIAVGDINNDGKADLLTMWRYPSLNVSDWFNKFKYLVHFGGRNADGTPASGFGSMAQRWAAIKGERCDAALICDIDQDKTDKDLVFVNRATKTIEVGLNTGQNDPERWIGWSFARPNAITSTNAISASLVRTAVEQPVWIEEENGKMVAMSMVKTNNVVAAQKLWGTNIPSGFETTIAAGDFDGDRDTDLVLTTFTYVLVSGNPAQNSKPTIGGLTLAGEAKIGRTVTLTAQNVADPDLGDKVTKVEFYLDLDNSSTVTAADKLLGSDSDGSNGWSTATKLESTFPTSARFLAIATDDLGLAGTPSALSQTLAANGRPVVAGLRFDKDQVSPGQSLTLSADDVRDAETTGSVAEVRFYRDTNRNGTFDLNDEMIGSDTDGSDGWSISTTARADWGAGVLRFFAAALDDTGDLGATRENSIVAGPSSTKITIGSFTASHARRQWTTRLGLSTSGVSAGTVAVYSFADTNRNGYLDDADKLVARGAADGLGNWPARIRITRALGTGPIKIFALASDETGENGDVRELFVTIRGRR